jgi:hypothetical protein
MPREKSNLPLPLKTTQDEVQVGDQVMVKSTIFGNEPCLAQVIEIKQNEIDVKKHTVENKTNEIMDSQGTSASASAVECENGNGGY